MKSWGEIIVGLVGVSWHDMRLSILLLNPIVGFLFFKDFPREDAAACGRMRWAQLNWNTSFFFFLLCK